MAKFNNITHVPQPKKINEIQGSKITSVKMAKQMFLFSFVFLFNIFMSVSVLHVGWCRVPCDTLHPSFCMEHIVQVAIESALQKSDYHLLSSHINCPYSDFGRYTATRKLMKQPLFFLQFHEGGSAMTRNCSLVCILSKS